MKRFFDQVIDDIKAAIDVERPAWVSSVVYVHVYQYSMAHVEVAISNSPGFERGRHQTMFVGRYSRDHYDVPFSTMVATWDVPPELLASLGRGGAS